MSRYRIDEATGKLTPASWDICEDRRSTGGDKPNCIAVGKRANSIAIAPDGNFVYVGDADNDNVHVYSVGNGTGRPAETAGSPFAVGGSIDFVVIGP